MANLAFVSPATQVKHLINETKFKVRPRAYAWAQKWLSNEVKFAKTMKNRTKHNSSRNDDEPTAASTHSWVRKNWQLNLGKRAPHVSRCCCTFNGNEWYTTVPCRGWLEIMSIYCRSLDRIQCTARTCLTCVCVRDSIWLYVHIDRPDRVTEIRFCFFPI